MGRRHRCPLPTVQPDGSVQVVATRPSEGVGGVHRHGFLDGATVSEAVDDHLGLLGDEVVEGGDPHRGRVRGVDLAVDHQLALDVGLAIHLDDALHALDAQRMALAVEELHEARRGLAVPPQVDPGGVAALEAIRHTCVVQLVGPVLAVVVAHVTPWGCLPIGLFYSNIYMSYCQIYI